MMELLVPRISDPTVLVAVLVQDHGLVQTTPEGAAFITEFTFDGQTVKSRYEDRPDGDGGGLMSRHRADAATLRQYDLDLTSAKRHP